MFFHLIFVSYYFVQLYTSVCKYKCEFKELVKKSYQNIEGDSEFYGIPLLLIGVGCIGALIILLFFHVLVFTMTCFKYIFFFTEDNKFTVHLYPPDKHVVNIGDVW